MASSQTNIPSPTETEEYQLPTSPTNKIPQARCRNPKNKNKKQKESVQGQLLRISRSNIILRYILLGFVCLFLIAQFVCLMILVFEKAKKGNDTPSENFFTAYIVSLMIETVGCLYIMVEFAFNDKIEDKMIKNNKKNYKNVVNSNTSSDN